MKIKILDETTILRIAAGEVVERPASVVKELVENSIDAGAKNISVSITGGGITELTVIDDGEGIPADEVENAFLRHSTSKISHFDDLYETTSLGFRGEALPSILIASDLEIKTKTEEQSTGVKLIFKSGVKESIGKVVMNKGTNITITNLFERIPVRKKFLKSSISEANAITELMYKLAVGHPDISFKYIRDGKQIFHTIRTDSMRSNLSVLFGDRMEQSLKEIQSSTDSMKITGYLSDNSYYRANRAQQYLYVNGRYIESKELTAVIERSYRALIPNGKFPVFQLFLEIAPQDIDVNVHPNKQYIKFERLDQVEAFLDRSIANVLYPRNLTPPQIHTGEAKGALPNLSVERTSEEIYTDLLNRYSPPSMTKEVEIPSYDISFSPEDIEQTQIEIYETEAETNSEYSSEIESVHDVQDIESDSSISQIKTSDNGHAFLTRLKYIGVLMQTYLLFEDLDAQELVLIDQHAAHERILYERYKEEFQRDDIPQQQLLIPEIIRLLPREMELFSDYRDKFVRLGIHVESFSEDTVALRSVPVLIDQANGEKLFTELLEVIQHASSLERIEEELIMRACKHAVKAGDQLSASEAMSLITQLDTCDNPLTCPHGRPTTIRMSKRSLEQEFMRIK